MSMDVNLKSTLQYDDRSGGEEEYNDVYNDDSVSYSEEYYDDGGDYSEANETGCMSFMDGDNSYEDDSIETTKHQMIAVFCDYEFIEVRKCCDKNHNLNLRYIITNMILHEKIQVHAFVDSFSFIINIFLFLEPDLVSPPMK